MPSTEFTTLALHANLLENLSSLGFHKMTDIQAQSLPAILAGQDVIAQAKTGSGKTAAFGLGLLNQLNSRINQPQALILCPTRELADQVAGEIQRLARRLANVKVLTLCGGSPISIQLNSLQSGAHVIVGTPGRIQDHINRDSLALSALKVLVLDEADRMLEMGFEPALQAIMQKVPKQRQTLLFSATFPSQIERISQQFLNQPLRITLEEAHTQATIAQHFYQVDQANKLAALKNLLLLHRPTTSVVFCNTKREVQDIADALAYDGFSISPLHGDLEQRERDETLIQFANKSLAILVATDVAARGLDIDTLDAVFNYEMAHDVDTHIHRIGRTGRSGQHGMAISLVDPNHYKDRIKLDLLGSLNNPATTIEPEALPNFKQNNPAPLQANWVTFQIDGGKKHKLRPGDILGALTIEGGLNNQQVGKIKITPQKSYVAIARSAVKQAMTILSANKIKNKNFRARLL